MGVNLKMELGWTERKITWMGVDENSVIPTVSDEVLLIVIGEGN